MIVLDLIKHLAITLKLKNIKCWNTIWYTYILILFNTFVLIVSRIVLYRYIITRCMKRQSPASLCRITSVFQLVPQIHRPIAISALRSLSALKGCLHAVTSFHQNFLLESTLSFELRNWVISLKKNKQMHLPPCGGNYLQFRAKLSDFTLSRIKTLKVFR